MGPFPSRNGVYYMLSITVTITLPSFTITFQNFKSITITLPSITYCDRDQCTLLVMLDLLAAFDTVIHTILLQCIQTQQGLCGYALNWIKSYLHDRTQSVMVDGKLSGKRVKDCDVPQGSVLGPDLYSDFT